MEISTNELIGQLITEIEIDEIAEKATHFGKITVGSVVNFNKNAIIEILTYAQKRCKKHRNLIVY